MTSIKSLLSSAITLLGTYTESPRIDAEVLLSAVLGKNRTFIYSHPEAEISSKEQEAFESLIQMRREGYPIAYLTGTREFWSLALKVNKATLIPRPETELLVELALSFLSDKEQAKILDLGTGSGAIALACAVERPHWEIFACDLSLNALTVAKENAHLLHINNVHFYHSNWFEKIHKEHIFDAILSNPPYIAQQDPHLLQGDLRFEPTEALVSGEDGLQSIRLIIQQSLARLKVDGLLLIEHGFEQKAAVESMLIDYGYKEVQCWQDWQGKDRVSGGRK